jgi:hypothetical protein
MGGTSAELFKDKRLEFPPLNENWHGKCLNLFRFTRYWKAGAAIP